MQNQKKQLRTLLGNRLNSLSAEECEISDEGILRHLLALPPTPGVVFCYVSVGNEPNTQTYIDALLQSGTRVCVPRCLGCGIMELREITCREDLCPAKFNLLEPRETAPLVGIEMVTRAIVPCIAADTAGRRLGHGGGYYDRTLAQLHCEAFCLCRQALLQDRLPEEPFDIRVNAVVTEKGLYWS